MSSEPPHTPLGSAVVESIGAELAQLEDVAEVEKGGDDETDVPWGEPPKVVYEKM